MRHQYLPRIHHGSTCRTHLLDGFLHVAGMDVHAAGGIFDQGGLESERQGVQHGVFHAEIGGESADIQLLEAFLLQVFPQAGGRAPAVVKEAALFNISTLRTQTCFRTPDGRFFGFEGSTDCKGCCLGSCTHVWNYEQATPFLFGSLAKTMREVEFAHATDANGLMSFRVHLPLSHAQDYPKAAADGQMGCIMKIYRDWQLSGDDDWLRAL